MARAKPKKRFVYVEDAPPFCFSEEHRSQILSALRLSESSPKANEFLNYLEQQMMLLRPERKLEINSPRPQEIVAALTGLKRKAEKLKEKAVDFQEEFGSLDAESRKLLRNALGTVLDGNVHSQNLFDFLSDLDIRIGYLIQAVNETDRIRFNSGRPRDDACRRFAIKVGFAFQNILGRDPTKSRTGAFGNVLNISFRCAGHYVQDIFPIIKDAANHCRNLKIQEK